MSTQAERIDEFRRLHAQPHPLILPNAWDVPSARLFEDAGFPAVATSSAGLMVSRGYPDGQRMPKRELIAVVAGIARRLGIPLSADIVAGYGRGAAGVCSTVRAMLAAGAVGINLEDYDEAEGRLFPLRGQARKISAVRDLGRSLGLPLVINARTDALWKGSGTPEERFQEAVTRCRAYRAAGADCLYPMRLTDAPAIAEFVRAVDAPVNVMVRAGLPPISELERLGVKRVSFGPSASYAALGLLKRASQEILSQGTYGALVDGAISFDELNRLAEARTAPSA